MSLRKLDMVCKKLDDESAASLRELYGSVMQHDLIYFGFDGFIITCDALRYAEGLSGRTRSGHNVEIDVVRLARKDGKITRMLVELNCE